MSTTKPPLLHRPFKAAELPLLSGEGSLKHKIQVLIQALIVQKQLRAGHYLPGEAALANHWGVDRQTVHRALRGLRDDGHLVSANGIGWYVPPGRSQDDIDDQFVVYASPDDPQVLRVVVGEDAIFELDFRRLEHGAEVGEVPGDWRRMVIARD